MSSPTLSVVLGTLNRLPFVRRALRAIAPACGELSYEVIAVDGGSTDGTLEYLRKQRRVHLIEQGERRGAVAAFNAGFGAAQADWVANYNDDAEYVGPVLRRAVELGAGDPRIGQICIPFVTCCLRSAEQLEPTAERTCAAQGVPLTPNVQKVRTPALGLRPYANFGVTRRSSGDAAGWWGEYFQYAGDTELSLKIYAAGERVLVLPPEAGFLVHYELQDSTRVPNVEQGIFDARWRPRAGATRIERTAPHTMLAPVGILYVGGKHGRMRWQRPGSPYQYVVGAQQPLFWANGADVDWLLSLRDRGRVLFRRAEGEQ